VAISVTSSRKYSHYYLSIETELVRISVIL